MLTRTLCMAYNGGKADCTAKTPHKPIKPWRKPMKTWCMKSYVDLCGGKVLNLSEI